MSSFIVQMKDGSNLLVSGALNAYAAIKVASNYAALHGVPLSAKPTNPDSPEEPEIALYVCADR